MKRIPALILVLSILIGGLGWVIYITPLDYKWAISFSSSVTPVSPDPTRTPTPSSTPFQPLTYTPTPSSTPTATQTPTPSHTPTITLTWTPSSTPTPSRTPSPTNTPTPLDKALIKDIRGRWPAFSLSCEARSAVDWAAYFGVKLDELEFYEALPASDDPDLGFVGDVNGAWGQIPPNSYGVHAGPVAGLLRSYNLRAQERTGMSFDQLRAEISAGRPAILWVVGRVGEGTPIVYTSSAGRETTVARFEHTVILIGYDEQEVTLLDGYWVYTRSIRDFLVSWGVLGNMAVVWAEE